MRERCIWSAMPARPRKACPLKAVLNCQQKTEDIQKRLEGAFQATFSSPFHRIWRNAAREGANRVISLSFLRETRPRRAGVDDLEGISSTSTIDLRLEAGSPASYTRPATMAAVYPQTFANIHAQTLRHHTVQLSPPQRRPQTSKQRFVGELSQCLYDFVVQLLPTAEELAVKEDVRKLLERLIRSIEPDSRLLSFGSTANGFSLRNSGKPSLQPGYATLFILVDRHGSLLPNRLGRPPGGE